MNNVFVCSNTTLESLDICPNQSILIHIKKHCPDTRCNKMVPLNKTMHQLTISVEKHICLLTSKHLSFPINT